MKEEKKLLKNIFKYSNNNKNVFFIYTKGLYLFLDKNYNLTIENFDICLSKK